MEGSKKMFSSPLRNLLTSLCQVTIQLLQNPETKERKNLKLNRKLFFRAFSGQTGDNGAHKERYQMAERTSLARAKWCQAIAMVHWDRFHNR